MTLFLLAKKINQMSSLDTPHNPGQSVKNSVFTKLTATGTLNTAYFKIGAAPDDSNDYLIYNSGTGALLYDADGNGAGAGTQIALLGTSLALTYADFVVI